ncbi:hypothetical protein GCM10019059_32680 [Camelimonas fluminis]|nr:hypothetical protein GCM10019059_32680 [Camelimonas fluminis]
MHTRPAEAFRLPLRRGLFRKSMEDGRLLRLHRGRTKASTLRYAGHDEAGMADAPAIPSFDNGQHPEQVWLSAIAQRPARSVPAQWLADASIRSPNGTQRSPSKRAMRICSITR